MRLFSTKLRGWLFFGDGTGQYHGMPFIVKYVLICDIMFVKFICTTNNMHFITNDRYFITNDTSCSMVPWGDRRISVKIDIKI